MQEDIGYDPRLEAETYRYVQGYSLPQWYEKLQNINGGLMDAGLSTNDAKRVTSAILTSAVLVGDGTRKNPFTHVSRIQHPESSFLASLGQMYLSGMQEGYLRIGETNPVTVRIQREQKPETQEAIHFELEKKGTIGNFLDSLRRGFREDIFAQSQRNQEDLVSDLLTRRVNKINSGSERSILIQKNIAPDPIDSRITNSFTALKESPRPSLLQVSAIWESIGLVLLEYVTQNATIPQNLLEIVHIFHTMNVLNNDEIAYNAFQMTKRQQEALSQEELEQIRRDAYLRRQQQEDEHLEERVKIAAQTMSDITRNLQEFDSLRQTISSYIAPKIGLKSGDSYTPLSYREQNQLIEHFFDATNYLAERFLS